MIIMMLRYRIVPYFVLSQSSKTRELKPDFIHYTIGAGKIRQKAKGQEQLKVHWRERKERDLQITVGLLYIGYK